MNLNEAKNYEHLFTISKNMEPFETLPEKTARARGYIECHSQWQERVKPLVEALEDIADCGCKVDWDILGEHICGSDQEIARKALADFNREGD